MKTLKTVLKSAGECPVRHQTVLKLSCKCVQILKPYIILFSSRKEELKEGQRESRGPRGVTTSI